MTTMPWDKPAQTQATEKLKHPERAVWNTRKYSRHSVEKDVPHFCGWQTLLKLVGAAKTEEEKALIAFTFETGGRISEVLRLNLRMFKIVKDAKPPILIVHDMPLVKKYQKESEHVECLKCHTWNPKGTLTCQCGANLLADGKKRYRTRRLEQTRNEFVIRLDEPLAKTMFHYLCLCSEKKQLLVFAHPTTGNPRNRRWAYRVLRRIGVDADLYLYPHRLRSERASHLASSLRAESLLEWFSWENWPTAKRYARRGALGLAKELGVELKASMLNA